MGVPGLTSAGPGCPEGAQFGVETSAGFGNSDFDGVAPSNSAFYMILYR